MRKVNPFVLRMGELRQMVGYFLFLKRPQVPLQIMFEGLISRSRDSAPKVRLQMISIINQIAEAHWPGASSRFELTRKGGPHMAMLNVYVDEETHRRLSKIAEEKDRSIEDLAECAVAEAALDTFRHRKDDPGRSS